MREIKFRAWDNGTMNYSPETYVNDTDSINAAILNYVNADTPLMQYTGLKDKNGVEIYEGDILSDNKRRRVISWDSISARFLSRSTGFGENKLGMTATASRSRVVGNIYENKELLK